MGNLAERFTIRRGRLEFPPRASMSSVADYPAFARDAWHSPHGQTSRRNAHE